MSTIYGESPEIQPEDGYSSNGGVALYSARNGGGTITSSDKGGEQVIGGRILWTITYNGGDPESANSYSGGITNQGWCTGYDEDNPFIAAGWQRLWEVASRDGDLDAIFSQLVRPYHFADYVAQNQPSCMSGNPW